MDFLLRRYVEWKGRRRAAQVIVFDGGAEVERTRSFVRGLATGALMTLGVFAMAAPTTADANLVEVMRQREALLRETSRRMRQAVEVADVCLATAERMQRTLTSYQAFLGGGGSAP